jgi:hypothetical protein
VRHEVASLSCTVVGQAANIISEQILDFNATPTKALLVVGNGTITNNDFLYTPLTRSDAFIVRLNGAVEAPSLTVSAITNSATPKVLVTKEYIDTIMPYKKYVALLSQSGTTAPTAIVLENNLGGTVVWARSFTGYYTATLSGVFTTDKTFFSGLKTGSNSDVNAQWVNTDTVVIVTQDNTTAPFTTSDDKLIKTSFEIRVYN